MCKWVCKRHILHYCIKPRKDRPNHCGDIAIFVIFQDGGRHLGFLKIWNFNFAVLGGFRPQNGQQYQRSPQNAHPCASPRRLSHQAWKSVDGSDLWVHEKSKKNKKINSLYFTHLPRRICTKFGTVILVVDVITNNKYFADRSRSVDSAGVENCPLPLTRLVAGNTGLALPAIRMIYWNRPALNNASEMTYTVSSGALNSTQTKSSTDVHYTNQVRLSCV